MVWPREKTFSTPAKEMTVASIAYGLFAWLQVALIWALATGSPLPTGDSPGMSAPFVRYLAAMGIALLVSLYFSWLYVRDRQRWEARASLRP